MRPSLGPTEPAILRRCSVRSSPAVSSACLHRSGPKLIAFLPTDELSATRLLEQAYRERFELACRVSWIGVVDSKVWAEGQVLENERAGLYLHSIFRSF